MKNKLKFMFSISPNCTPKVRKDEKAFTICSRDFKDPQIVVLLTDSRKEIHNGFDRLSYGLDTYNQQILDEQAHTLRTCIGGDNIGKVIVVNSGMERYHRRFSTIAIDTTNITSPTNASNPKVNDPCHTLCKGAHVPLVIIMDSNSEE